MRSLAAKTRGIAAIQLVHNMINAASWMLTLCRGLVCFLPEKLLSSAHPSLCHHSTQVRNQTCHLHKHHTSELCLNLLRRIATSCTLSCKFNFVLVYWGRLWGGIPGSRVGVSCLQASSNVSDYAPRTLHEFACIGLLSLSLELAHCPFFPYKDKNSSCFLSVFYSLDICRVILLLACTSNQNYA